MAVLSQTIVCSWRQWSLTYNNKIVEQAINKNGTLCIRLKETRGENADVMNVVKDWARERKKVRRIEVHHAVNLLRKIRKYEEALQLYAWMDENFIRLFHSDHAIRINLLFKMRGIEAAEVYFNSLRRNERTKKTYGSLLCCYCETHMIEKATSLALKMREVKAMSSALNYNVLMALHMKNDEPDRVHLLAEEMYENNIRPDIYTYNLLISSYASMEDFEALKGVLEKMKTSGVELNWFTYGNLASIYVKIGFLEEARASLDVIRKMKGLNDFKAFQTVIKIYGQLSNAEGVNWGWESLKTHYPILNDSSYRTLLTALDNVGDAEGVERCFGEWESSCSSLGIDSLNAIVTSRLDRDMLEEANMVIERAREKRGVVDHDPKTLALLMDYHLRKNQLGPAFRYLEMGLSVRERFADFPSEESVSAFLNLLEVQKDADGAEKFRAIMETLDRVDTRINDSLLRTYAAAGARRPCPAIASSSLESG